MIERKPVLVSTLPLSPIVRQMIADYESEPEAWKLGVIADWLTDNDPASPLLAYMNAQSDTFHSAFANYGLKDWLGYIDGHQKAQWRGVIRRKVEEMLDLVGIRDWESAFEYAEPGYSDPLGIIVFANWNYDNGNEFVGSWIDPKELEFDAEELLDSQKVLESLGCEIEWSDEWAICFDCGKAVRTQPNCWDWSPFYSVPEHSGDLVCHDCWDPSVDQEEVTSDE